MSPRAKTLLLLAALFCAIVSVSLIAAFLHSERLDAVTVRFTGPGTEAKDDRILGLGKDHVRPDYRLDLVRERGTSSCGTIQDTSAAGGIRFVVSGKVPLRAVRELILVEDDRVTDDDPVTRVPFTPPSMTSAGYVFGVESSRSFEIGLFWFLGTPIGVAILVVTALFFLWLFGALARSAISGDAASPPDFPDLEPPDLC